MIQIATKLLITTTLSLVIFFLLLNEASTQITYKTSHHKLKENQINMFTEEDLSDTILINKLNKKEEEKIEQELQEEWMTFEATAYIAFCSTGCIGITRTGYDVSETIYYKNMRVIAVDPRVIPLHSIVEVDTGSDIFTAIALDTGGAIKGEIIDILTETRSAALKFGRRNVQIKVVEWGE